MGLSRCYSATMKQGILLIFSALLFPVAGCHSRPRAAEPAVSGSASAKGAADGRIAASGSGFDYYLLNLSWSPEYCYAHPAAEECAAHAGFVLHGLWPENTDGSYPENCSNAAGPADPAQDKDIYPDPSLLEHEWRTHGTCSGLGQEAFFQAARSAYRAVAIPPAFHTLTSQVSLAPDQIIELFMASNPAIPRSSFALSCGHNYLTAVEVCLDKRLHPIACTGIRSCRANTVRIPPP
jgi:ribonuclease T2